MQPTDRPSEEPLGLGSLCWPDVAPDLSKPMLLVPVGSTEQHGPHLPLGTDSMIAEALAHGAARALQNGASAPNDEQSPIQVLVAPVLHFTASGEHEGFPGTLSIGTEVFASILIELVRSASTWCRRIIFVNGHGGNAEAFRVATQTWKRESRQATVWSPHLPEGGDWHAGWVETSVMLALHPGLVMEHREPGEVAQNAKVGAMLRTAGVRAVSPNGVLGDPTNANRSVGQQLLGDWTAALVTEVLAQRDR